MNLRRRPASSCSIVGDYAAALDSPLQSRVRAVPGPVAYTITAVVWPLVTLYDVLRLALVDTNPALVAVPTLSPALSAPFPITFTVCPAHFLVHGVRHSGVVLLLSPPPEP
jgi:hypothetical protein